MNAAGLKNRDIIAAPGRLWSLWDMLKQYARNFGEMSMLKELSYKANEEAIKTRIAGPLMDPLKGRIEFWLSCAEIHARDLDLDNSIIESSTLRMRIEHGIPHGITPLEAQIGLQNLFNSFKNQTSSRKFFYVQPRNVPMKLGRCSDRMSLTIFPLQMTILMKLESA